MSYVSPHNLETIERSYSSSEHNLTSVKKHYSVDPSGVLERNQKWHTQARHTCHTYRAAAALKAEEAIKFVQTGPEEGEENATNWDEASTCYSASPATTLSLCSWTSSDSLTICESIRSLTPVCFERTTCQKQFHDPIDQLREKLHNALEELAIEVTRLTLRYPRENRKAYGTRSPQSDQKSSHNKPQPSKLNSSKASSSLIPQPLRKSKRPAEDDEDVSENEDDNHKRRKGPNKAEAGDDDDHQRYFACPFLKWNPRAHQECMFIKLRTIATIKQHLSREHKIGPSFCPRCYHRFSSKDREDEKKQHHTDESKCEKRDEKPWEYRMHEKINPRKGRQVSERETWFMIYETLFPDAYRPKSPFLGDDSFEAYAALLTHIKKNSLRSDFSGFQISEFPRQYRESFHRAQNSVLQDRADEQVQQSQQEQGENNDMSTTEQYENTTVPFNHGSTMFAHTQMAQVSSTNFGLEVNHNPQLGIPYRFSAPTQSSSPWVLTNERPFSYQDPMPSNLYPNSTESHLGSRTNTSSESANTRTDYPLCGSAWSDTGPNTNYTTSYPRNPAPRHPRQSNMARLSSQALNIQNQAQQNLHQPQQFQQDWTYQTWHINETSGA